MERPFDYQIMAVDFDGTLCKDKWPEIGEPNSFCIEMVKLFQSSPGYKTILWTCRAGERLEEAVRWCAIHGLIFDAVNENLPEVIEWMGGDSRKIFADVYVDDKGLRWEA